MLSEAASLVICTITNNLHAVSPTLRKVTQILAAAARARWPDDAEAEPFAVSSFFFLRYVCPFLFVGGDSPSKNVAYTLKQVAKLIQAMANKVDVRQDDWPGFDLTIITIHQTRINFFLQQLALPLEMDEMELYGKVSDDLAIDGFEEFVTALREHTKSTLPDTLQ